MIAGIALGLGITLAQAVAALDAPSDRDLKASYCLAILNDGLKSLEGLQSQMTEPRVLEAIQRQRAETHYKRGRVVAYLQPRLSRLDLVPVLAAARQADADVDYGERLASERCHQSDPWEKAQCGADVVKTMPARAKIDACQSIDWLPF